LEKISGFCAKRFPLAGSRVGGEYLDLTGRGRGWTGMHSDELHNFYASSNIGMIKSRRVRWTGHIA